MRRQFSFRSISTRLYEVFSNNRSTEHRKGPAIRATHACQAINCVPGGLLRWRSNAKKKPGGMSVCKLHNSESHSRTNRSRQCGMPRIGKMQGLRLLCCCSHRAENVHSRGPPCNLKDKHHLQHPRSGGGEAHLQKGCSQNGSAWSNSSLLCGRLPSSPECVGAAQARTLR